MLGMALGAGVVATRDRAAAQEKPAAPPNPLFVYPKRSAVSLIHGESRRKNITDSLIAIDDQILPVLRTKKSVVIKPNMVSTVNPLAATNADTLRGILDYLAPRFKGPVYIAESSAGDTYEGFDNFKYHAVVNEFRGRQVSPVSYTHLTLPTNREV